MWEEFTPLARATGAINLGQGFPDWASPRFVKDAIIRAVEENHNQYCRSAGQPALVQALAKRYSAQLGRPINWETEVTIGVGSTETLFSIMQSFLNPGGAGGAAGAAAAAGAATTAGAALASATDAASGGGSGPDEVVLISPAFDIYAAQVEMAGGVAKYVPLRVVEEDGDAASGGGGRGQRWSLDLDELRAAFTPRTRLLLLNTPQNPTGKVFSRAELEGIAAIVRDHPRVLVVSDEVYENMAYDTTGALPHVSISSLEGMWDRTLLVASAGKTFSITGWKVG